MANSSNAFITKQANSVNPSDWINKQEQIGLQYDAIQRQKEKDELARQDKLRGEFNENFEGEFDLSSMGNDAVNKVFTPMAMQSLQDLKLAKDEGEKALNAHGINSKEYRSAKSKYDNILKRPKLFKLAFEQTSKKLNERNALVSSGAAIQSPDSIQKLQDIITQPIKYKQDAEGRYILMQGENAYTMDEFADKLEIGRVIPRVDEGSIIEGITSSIGDKEFSQRMGYETITRTNPWNDYKDPKTGEKGLGIKSILTKGYETALTDDVMESVLAGRGQFGYDEMPAKIKDELKAKILSEWLDVGRGQVEEKLGVKFDSSRYNNDSDNALKKNKTESTPLIGVAEPTKETYSEYIDNIDENNVNSVSISGAKSIPTATTEDGETLTDIVPHNFTRDKQGRLIVAASYVNSKSTKLQKNKMEQELKSWDEQKEYNEKVKEYEKSKNTAALEDLKEARKQKKIDLEETTKTLGVQKVSKAIIVPKDQEALFSSAAGVSLEGLNAQIKKKSTSELPSLDDLPDLP